MSLTDAQLEEAFASISKSTDISFLATNETSTVFVGPTADGRRFWFVTIVAEEANPQVIVEIVQPDRQVLRRLIMADYVGWRCLVDDLGVSDPGGFVQDPSAPDRTSAEWLEAQRRFGEVIEEDLGRRRGGRELGY